MGTVRGHAWRRAGEFKRTLIVLFTITTGVGVGEAERPTPPSPEESDNEIVATVGGREIAANMLRKEMARRGGFGREGAHGSSVKTAALNELIRTEMMAAAAVEAGLDKDPEIVEAHNRLLAEKYWREQLRGLGSETRVSDGEVQAYYDAHHEQLREPVRVRGAVIFFRYPAAPSEADKTRLRRNAEQVLAGTSHLPPADRFFGDLARQHSADPASARRRGDIGWLVQGATLAQWEPAVVDALFALETPGKFGPLVTGERGVYLVRIVDRKGGGEKPLAAVEREIRDRIYADKGRAAQARRMEALQQRFPVAIKEDVLQRLGSAEQGTVQPNAPPAFPVGTP